MPVQGLPVAQHCQPSALLLLSARDAKGSLNRSNRTELSFQDFIAVTAAWSTSPSKMPLPWTQEYSVPDRLIPRRITWLPFASSSLLPDTCSCAAPLVVTVVSVTVMVTEGMPVALTV